MLKKIICTLLLVFLGFGVSVNASAADRYQWIASTDEVTISYDTQTIRYNSNYDKTVDVWVLWKYTEVGARELVEGCRKDGLWKESKWDNFAYVTDHKLYTRDASKTLLSIYYDNTGKVLHSHSDKYPEWYTIAPNTLGEAIKDTFIGFLGH